MLSAPALVLTQFNCILYKGVLCLICGEIQKYACNLLVLLKWNHLLLITQIKFVENGAGCITTFFKLLPS